MTRQILVFIAMISLAASVSVAGTPTVKVYFDEGLTTRTLDGLRPGPVTLYVTAEGFDANLRAIEYKIDFPAGLTWIGDADVPAVTIGSTRNGIVQAWTYPVNGFSPVIIAKVQAQWEPSEYSGGKLMVRPHPRTGHIRATADPDLRIIEAQGESSGGRSSSRSAEKNEPVLEAAQPNPFNPVTRISYWLPVSAPVRLTVHDAAGRRVTTLAEGVRGEGEHVVEWHADDVASGVYFVRLEVGSVIQQKKVVLLK